MEEHLVAFIDLLGFRSIITTPDDARQAEILQLLTSLAEAKGDFRSDTRSVGLSTWEKTIRPAISAFSDNIVFSFPDAGLAHVGTGPIVLYLAKDVARIFSRAIAMGCLIRGGIAYGPLHHADGVLFGPALVEAYELESKFAGRPRVLVSDRAAGKVGRNPYLRPDDDGFLYLDYVRAAYDQVTSRSPHMPWEAEYKRKWIAWIRERCRNQITLLSETNNLAGLQNWRWFAAQFEGFVAELHPSITGEGASAGPSHRPPARRPGGKPPTAADIIDPNFTGGLSSEEHLERLRNGDLG